MRFHILLTRLIFIFCIGTYTIALYGQASDPSQNILPPSPNAASITKYVDFPVNTSTGLPSISIPLGAVSGRGITVPVSLDYHAGGVKVDDVASIVGLGWSLSAGGSITRTVMDKPDEDIDGYIQHSSHIPPVTITNQTELNHLDNFAVGGWDAQPDVFQFSCGGYSGKFIIENTTIIRLIPQQDIRITYTTCTSCPGQTFGGSIISFTVTTPDGIQYLFGTSDAVEYSTTSSYATGGSTSCNVKTYDVQSITAWHLKSITHPQTGEVVNFTYGVHRIRYDQSYNETYSFPSPLVVSPCPNTTSQSKCVTTKTDFGKHLVSIVSSKGKAEFTSNSTRTDIQVLEGQYRINEVKFYGRENTLLKSSQFTQTFIQSTGSTPSTASASSYRMYLDEVREYGSDGVLINAQTVEYNNRQALPPRLSFKQDKWGYYNGKPNGQMTPGTDDQTGIFSTAYVQGKIPTFNPANREPDANYSILGNIKKITYPTGGYTEYEFEGNEIAVCNTVDVPTPTLAAESVTFTGAVQTKTKDFYIDHDQSVQINYNVLMNGFRCYGAYAKLIALDAGNPFTGKNWGGCAQMVSPIQLQGNVTQYLKAGNYRIEVKVFQGPESGYPAPYGTQPEQAALTVQYVDNVPTYITNKPTGGLRLKKLTANDGTGVSPAIVKAYKYDKTGSCSNASSGIYTGKSPRYWGSDYSLVDIPGEAPAGIACDVEICTANRLTSNSLLPLIGSGSIVNYLEVWAYDGLNAENGKTYYKHQVFLDGNSQTAYNYYGNFIHSPSVDYSWKNGKVVEEAVYNSQNQLVSQKMNEYEFNESNQRTVSKGMVAKKAYALLCNGPWAYYCDGVNNEGDEYYVTNSCELLWCPVYTYGSCYNQPAGTVITQNGLADQYAVEHYSIISQFVYLKKETARQYASNGSGNYTETITEYQYDLPGLRHRMPITTIVTNSDETKYFTRSVYPPQYNTTSVTDVAATAIKALRDNFILNQPIEVVSSIQKTGQSELVTAAKLTKYKNFGGTKIMPNELWQLATNSPINNFTNSGITNGTFNSDSRYYQTTQLGSYDANGNLKEWNQTDNTVSSFLYSNGENVVSAYTLNAAANEVAFTGFEDPGQGAALNGSWSITGSAGGWSSAAADRYAGKNGFNIANTRTVTRSSLPAGTYVVSFFFKGGNIRLNGTNVNGSYSSSWAYAEQTVTVSAGGSIAITGAQSSAFIDELRLYPTDALMRTFNFDNNSLLLLSTGNENAVPAHYEYDNAQRLRAIRDQDNNIKQTFEYAYHPVGSTLNSITSRSVLISGQTTLAAVNALSAPSIIKSVQYFDGLGRPVQQVQVAQSPAGKDIVMLQQYDAFNREIKGFLPYTATTNGGTYRPWTTASADQLAFGNSFGANGYPWLENKFEASPANRLIEKGQPGTNWRIGQNTAKITYRPNTSTDNVHNFSVAGSTNYAANKLWVEETEDENQRLQLTFKDKLGRVLLVKQQVKTTLSSPPSDDDFACTYTVYNDLGQTGWILPPETSKKMKTSGNWDINASTYEHSCYKYTYDNLGRQWAKSVPSAGTTYFWYDRLHRPVLTQDANGFKTFTRYDILGRVIMTGRYKGAAIPGQTGPLYETPNTTATSHYYTATAFPHDNNIDVYQVSYYDDYDLDNNGSVATTEAYQNPAESPFDVAAFSRVRGKNTAVKSAILKTDATTPTVYLLTRTYFDKEGTVIQVNRQNHLSGADVVSTAYDFADRVTKTRRDHTATPPSGTLKTFVVREEMVYDHANRLRFTTHQVGTQQKVVLAANKYDEMGRVMEKNLHAADYTGTALPTLSSTYNYLQSLDYTYNIRGWLTGMNDPSTSTCTIQSGDYLADAFAFSLGYESTANGATAQHNGNISAMQWRTNTAGTCGTRQLYRFSYDGANRLIGADHLTWSGTAWANPNRYNESNITYDLNGNLKTYTRQGVTGGTTPATYTYGTIDQLTYTYGDALRPDRLTQVADVGSSTKGFVYNASAAIYQYDTKGNMTRDNHKGFVIAYNHLNLPVTFTKGSNVITIMYAADGTKLTKTAGSSIKQYVAGIEYSGANVEALYHSEGRCTPNGSNFFYEYTLKDHLGNARVNFRANGTTITHLEELHYYPFGMLMEGLGTSTPSNDYAYNGKELNEDFGLNLSDYGARWYDAALGRWGAVDPNTDSYPNVSGYSAYANNPINVIDPDGRDVILLTWASHDGKIGHAGIAVSNYKEVSTRVKEDGKWITKKEMVADGTYTYRDLWPGTPAGKSNFDKDVPAAYNTGVFTLDELMNKDVTGSEGYAADGLVQLKTDQLTDAIVTMGLDAHEKYNTSYNGLTNNCSDFCETGVEYAAGKQLPTDEKLTSKTSATTPNQLFKAASTLPNSTVIKDPGDKIKQGFLEAVSNGNTGKAQKKVD